MLRTIEIAVKKPLHTTPSIIQFLQQSKSQVMQREKESDVVLQRMRIGSEIPLITLSDGVAIRWWVQEGVGDPLTLGRQALVLGPGHIRIRENIHINHGILMYFVSLTHLANNT